ncbi:hypothetical protein LTR84_010956 [Exophiala bonariae]|uniref:Aconitate hydratase, mitochondrial n=1 Tax=Exophiala bonariae TaxID=1690606 RepID=A0AAV9NIY1_9EURO|nr:hypothetical protein LTR84_010956 [Exophiala bonariae]
MSQLEPHTILDYASRLQKLQHITRSLNKPLTLSENILFSRLDDSVDPCAIERGQTMLQLRPDRVACHDATATMALLQFIAAGLERVAIPTTIHSDHLIVAKTGAESDIARALTEHQEVYDFLSSASNKYGIGYWKAGSGILHVILLENYAFPGGLMIGTDSHTPNAGGLGMIGIGVGGSDAVDAMAGMQWEVMCPKITGVYLSGRLGSGWTSSKDIICKLAGILGVAGGKGKIIEFFGPGVHSLSTTSMATVCNMSAEIGSTSCLFPYTEAMGRYLSATKRMDIAKAARTYSDVLLTADVGSEKYYDEVIHIDLDTLEPHINGPFTPDLSHPLSSFGAAAAKSGWPLELSSSMVGSCTNSSYEDLKKVQHLVRQAKAAGLSRVKVPFLVSPGSEQIRATAQADGVFTELEDAGATILSSSCGPCVGQWDRTDVPKGEKNSVISSYNRNFAGRHDGNPQTHSFVTSPEMATAFAFAGNLAFNPITQALQLPGRELEFRFNPPQANELPQEFLPGEDRYQPPTEDYASATVKVDPRSDRLQLIAQFPPWADENATNMHILIKVKGKCTTDHISPAGPWYKYRGHLENISNNMLIAATNEFVSETGHARNPLTGDIGLVPRVAQALKNRRIKWCIIADTNYGEGSSREHAALEPRYLGGIAVIAKSFARIHETNLKKQGMLPLTFSDPADYDRIQEGDCISLEGVQDGQMAPRKQVIMRVTRKDGTAWEASLSHTYHENQLQWLRAGSALNHIRNVAQRVA